MNELVTVHDNYLSTYDEVERAAKAMAGSGFFTDTKQAAQAIVKIMAGAELGVGAFASMVGVNIIQGKPTFSANIMAAVPPMDSPATPCLSLTRQSCCSSGGSSCMRNVSHW